MYAWRRVSVAALNRRGREAWRSLGRLSEDELVAPGGTPYAVGDRVVTLAPGAGGKIVTSETGTVAALGPDALIVRMDHDGALRTLERDEIAAGRLSHAYAMTVHRSQGSTVERAHAFEDGGGRELAYVKMSRAKDRSMVYVIADSVDQAAEYLRREWASERRLTWVIDNATPAAAPAQVALPKEVLRARLVAERDALAAHIPPDLSGEIRLAKRNHALLRARQQQLQAGTGHYADQPIGQAVRDLPAVDRNIVRLENKLRDPKTTWLDRRRSRSQAEDWRRRRELAMQRVDTIVRPEADRLDALNMEARHKLSALKRQQNERRSWLSQNPEAIRQLESLEAQIAGIDGRSDTGRPPRNYTHGRHSSPGPQWRLVRSSAWTLACSGHSLALVRLGLPAPAGRAVIGRITSPTSPVIGRFAVPLAGSAPAISAGALPAFALDSRR